MGEWADIRPAILLLDPSFRMVWISIPSIVILLYTLNSSRPDVLD